MPMASSRIFVKGLPPNFKENDLKRHFDRFDSKDPTATALTDARFIPHRRIGYVGYKTPEAAAKAVKYFNKSFIRMSKIAAEIARPVDDQGPTAKRRKLDGPAPEQFSRPLAAKRDADAHDEKLARFVDTLQSTSKGKLWSNQDTSAHDEGKGVAKNEPDPDQISDDEYQTLSKFKGAEAGTLTHDDTGNDREMPQQDTDLANHTLENGDQNIDGDPEPDGNGQSFASDADWMRSRTNRVLDLLSEGEIDAKTRTTASSIPKDTTVDAASATKPSEVDKEVERQETQDKPQSNDDDQPSHTDSGRLLVRNLLYDASDEDLLEYFRGFGDVDEVHICCDQKSGKSKGYAFVQFETSESANEARLQLHGKPFQGRNLHIEPAVPKKMNNLNDIALSKLPLKVQNQIRRKANASSESFKWNSLYMSTDAIMSSVATRLGVSKSDVLDPTSADAAVQQAHAETKTIQDTQTYFQKNGIDIEAFKQSRRGKNSDTAILVKNFPFGTTASDLRAMFERHGSLKRLLIPPTATIAVVEMNESVHAKAAFRALAYSRFQDSVLLLEKAPASIFKEDAPVVDALDAPVEKLAIDEEAEKEFERQEAPVTSTLFAEKLPWSSTSESLQALFQGTDGFLSARVMTKTDPKKPGKLLSRGFGFVEFRSKTQAKDAMLKWNGHMLDGQFPLTLRPSNRSNDAAEERRREDAEKRQASQGTKIIIKNLPFEVTQKDIRALCAPYGQLRSVRLPKKIDHTPRGFAFVDFISAKEASNAMEALKHTHLLGRRLALAFSVADTLDPEQEIERMQQKVEHQTDKVARQKLATGERKRFRAYSQHDDEA